MNSLAMQQQALLNALLDWPPDAQQTALQGVITSPQGRGLKVYRANAHMLAERALRAAYPVVAQWLGAESFHDLARALWHAHPPQRGDVGQWGADLAAFIKASDQLTDEPYLCDVARLEWGLHRAATAADSRVDLRSLGWLTTHDPAMLKLRLSPGLQVLRSAWPVVSLVLAHRDLIAGAAPDWSGVAQMLRDSVGESGVIWRNGWSAQLRACLPGEVEFLEAIVKPESLSDALHHSPDLDFAQWFPLAVQSGLVVGVEMLSGTTVTLD